MLPGLQLGVYTSPTGSMISDWTAIAENVEYSKDEHGCKTLSCFVPATFIESWLLCNAPGVPHVELSYNGFPIWQGRLEDKSIKLVPGGIDVVAFGYYRAFSDQPYTATHTGAAPSAIIGALLSNAPALSTNTKLIQNPGTTITERYEDLYPSEIVDRLIELGDDQTPPRKWECGVNRDYYVYFRPRGSNGRTWYVYTSEAGFELNYSLATVWNSVYAVYANANNNRAVTATTTDAASISRFGLTRTAMVSSRTKSSSQAGRMRDAYLDDHAEQTPHAVIPFSEIFDSGGNPWPLWSLESGDVIVEGSLPPTLDTTVDKISTFRIKEFTYNLSTNAIKVVPESMLITLDEQIAGESSPLNKLSKRVDTIESAVGFAHDINPDGGSGGSNLVPGGAIMLFAGACPTGWTEYTAARGRAIVGVPSGGTLEGTVGSALSDLATRTISTVVAHTHGAGTLVNASEAAHTHGDGTLANSSESAHTHDVDPPNATTSGQSADHTHTVDPPSTSSSSDAHAHDIVVFGSGGGPIAPFGGTSAGGGSTNSGAIQNDSHSHTVNIASFASGGTSVGHTHTVNVPPFTSDAGSAHTHTITGTTGAGSSHNHDITGSTASAGSATVDVTMPYIQLRLCKKD